MVIQDRGTVTVEHEGKPYTASWRVENDMMIVSTADCTKSTQLGDLPPESLARLMLSEIIDAGESLARLMLSEIINAGEAK